MWSAIFYNAVVFPYILEENPQILIQSRNILAGVVSLVLLRRLTFHIFKINQINDEDEIPINDQERNVQVMNQAARLFGHY